MGKPNGLASWETLTTSALTCSKSFKSTAFRCCPLVYTGNISSCSCRHHQLPFVVSRSQSQAGMGLGLKEPVRTAHSQQLLMTLGSYACDSARARLQLCMQTSGCRFSRAVCPAGTCKGCGATDRKELDSEVHQCEVKPRPQELKWSSPAVKELWDVLEAAGRV